MKAKENDAQKETKEEREDLEYKIFTSPDVKGGDFGMNEQKETELPKDAIQEIEFWEEMDRRAIEKIELKYGDYIDKERLKEAKSIRTRFETHEQFLRDIKNVYPEKDCENILGYMKEGTQPVIDKDQRDKNKTIFHERLHQIRREDFKNELGPGMDEGLTEHFAIECAGNMELKDIPECYPNERRIIETLIARVGERPFVLAYFRGYIPILEDAIDKELGKGALREIAYWVEKKDYNRAEEIARKGSKNLYFNKVW